MAVGFEHDNVVGTIKYNGVNILDVTEKAAMKGAANGYAALDNNQKVIQEPATKGINNGIASIDNNGNVVQPTALIRTTAPPNNTGAVGMSGGKLQFGDGAQVRTVEQTDQRDVNGGYASIDNNGAVVKPFQEIRVWNPPNNAGKIGLNSGDIKFGDGAQVRTLERVDRKGAANGYPGLDNNQRVIEQVQLVASVAPSTTSGSIGMNAGKLQHGDGAQVRTVEITSNKDIANGYVGTDANNFLNAARIPSYVGCLAKDFDPGPVNYIKNQITTIKTYTAGPGSSIEVTGFQLPARGNNQLKTRILFKFNDNSSKFVENATDGTLSDTFQGVANFLMGDAAAGVNADSDGKRVVAVAFEVQNLDVNNDINADLGVFRVRAYVVPAGGGAITVTP